MLELASEGSNPLSGLIDRQRIGVAGHSAGGITTMGVALDTCCHDFGVQAAIIMAGDEYPYRGGVYPTPDSPPALFLHGTDDSIIAYQHGLLAYHDARAPKYIVTLNGWGHAAPFVGDLSRADGRVVTEVTIDFLNRYLKGDTTASTTLQHDAAVPGVASLQQVAA